MNGDMAQYMSRMQKGVVIDIRRGEHQLLVDNSVTVDFKTRKTNLFTDWKNYRKTPTQWHTWILEC